eukprot:SAG22_NODE_12158_length_454_cov_0.870423_1_plen_71_part_10
MPLLKDPELGDDFYLAQSSTIVRYLASKNGMDGNDGHQTDPAHAARIDMVYEGSKDIAGKKSAIYLSGDDA